MKHEIKSQCMQYPFDGSLSLEAADVFAIPGSMMLCRSPAVAADWRARVLRLQGVDAGPTPPVFAWSRWLAQQALDLHDMPVPLTPLQEAALWERVITADLKQQATANMVADSAIRSLAREAGRAYRLIRDYRVDLNDLGGSDEGESLHRWIRAVHGEFTTGALRDRCLMADVAGLLLERLKAGGMHVPARLLLDPHEELPPVQLALLQAMHANHARIYWLDWPGEPGAVMQLTQCADVRGEVDWALSSLLELIGQRPRASIGVVADEAMQAELLRQLDEALADDPLLAAERGSHAVRVQAPSLMGMPMVLQLFRLLDLVGRPICERKSISEMLRLPWLDGYPDEAEARLRLDVLLRRRNRHRLSLASLTSMPEMASAPRLKRLLVRLMQLDLRQQPPSSWVDALSGLLEDIGFVRNAANAACMRTDFEVRQVNALREALASLVSLDDVMRKLSWSTFLSQWKAACQSMSLSFQPRHANIEILRLDELEGRSFDVLLMTGMDEEALPGMPRPHPLLPSHVQRRHRMPRADADWCMQWGLRLLQQLRQRCGEIRLSFARMRLDQEMACSPLLRSLDCRQHVYQPNMDDGILAGLETYAEAPEVPLGEDEAPHGGSGILVAQSACPFRAFAGYRLGLAELEETEPGIDPASRGSLVHAALEWIWQRLKHRQQLASLTGEELERMIGQAVEHALAVRARLLPEQTRVVEQQRMQQLLRAWLQLELERPDFEVLATEQPFELHLPSAAAGRRISIHLKLDRVDRLAGQHRLILDYKTGAKQSAGKWLGERPEAPQLPLYALAAGLGDGDGVSFARVRAGDMGFEGLCDADLGIRGIRPCDGSNGAPEDWAAVLKQWRQAMDDLAAEFVAGVNTVSPRNSDACRHCGLEAVCRIDEIGFANGEESE